METCDSDPIPFRLLFERSFARDRTGVADFAAMSAGRHKVIGAFDVDLDRSVGIGLSRIRCTKLPARTLLHARPRAGLRAPRNLALSACWPPLSNGSEAAFVSWFATGSR